VRELGRRVLTAAVLVPIALVIVLAGSTGQFAAAIGVIIAIGAWEWARLVGFASPSGQIGYAALVVAGLMAMAVWRGMPELVAGVLAAGLAWWTLALLWLGRPELGRSRRPGVRLAKAVIGLVVFWAAWSALVGLHGAGPNGSLYVLYLFVLIWIADAGAYFAGRRWGRRKLASRISPGKTQEGALAALALGAVWGVAGGFFFGAGAAWLILFVLLAVVTVALSIVGDLFQSLIKRQAGAKDSGNLLPGHGGVLDRIDSLLAAAPVFCVGLMWLP
jgi:phosphatidate cytidylyltransferase